MSIFSYEIEHEQDVTLCTSFRVGLDVYSGVDLG